MTSGAPRLASDLRSLALTVVELDTTELRKGGGGIRCTALTLDDPARRVVPGGGFLARHESPASLPGT